MDHSYPQSFEQHDSSSVFQATSSVCVKAPSLSPAQRNKLIELVKFRHVISEINNSHEVTRRKQEAWREVAEEFNKCYPLGDHSTVRRLKRAWEYLRKRLRENPELENIYKRATESDEAPGPACKKRNSSSTAVAPMSSSTLAYHAAHQFDSLSDEFSESMLRMSGLMGKNGLASASSTQHQKDLGNSTSRSGQEEVSSDVILSCTTDEMSSLDSAVCETVTVTNVEGEELSTATIEVRQDKEENSVVSPVKQKDSSEKDPLSIGEQCYKQNKKPGAKKPEAKKPLPAPPKPQERAYFIVKKHSLEGEKKEDKSADANDLFFQSILATIRKLTPLHQNLCKRKIFAVVSELEMKEMLEKESSMASVLATPRYPAATSTIQNMDAVSLSPSIDTQHSDDDLDFKFHYEEI